MKSMDLKNWLTTNEVSISDFAGRINVSRQAVHRWLDGSAFPEHGHVDAITKVTKGKVGAQDWLVERIRKLRREARFLEKQLVRD